MPPKQEEHNTQLWGAVARARRLAANAARYPGYTHSMESPSGPHATEYACSGRTPYAEIKLRGHPVFRKVYAEKKGVHRMVSLETHNPLPYERVEVDVDNLISELRVSGYNVRQGREKLDVLWRGRQAGTVEYSADGRQIAIVDCHGSFQETMIRLALKHTRITTVPPAHGPSVGLRLR